MIVHTTDTHQSPIHVGKKIHLAHPCMTVMCHYLLQCLSSPTQDTSALLIGCVHIIWAHLTPHTQLAELQILYLRNDAREVSGKLQKEIGPAHNCGMAAMIVTSLNNFCTLLRWENGGVRLSLDGRTLLLHPMY